MVACICPLLLPLCGRGKALCLGVFLMLAALSSARAQAPVSRLTGFLLGVEPQRRLVLRLLRFAPTGAGFVPIDSVALTTDGPIELRSADDQAGLYLLALDPYSRTEVVLAPAEVPHVAATVRQLAQQGVYVEKSPENQAYHDILPLIQHYDTLIGQVHEGLMKVAEKAVDTSRAYAANARLLERYHRNLNRQLRDRQARYPGTFAATVLAPLALLPERAAADVGTAGYVPWLRAHYLDTFPLTTDTPLRHYLGAARIAYFLNALGPLGPGGTSAAADALMARREGHDLVNAWLYRTLVAEATRHDDDLLAAHLRLDYPPDACAPALPPALADQLAQMAELAVGQQIPDLTAADSTGQPVALRATAARQRLTVVAVWVSWCHTCEVELPQLAAAYPALRRQGLEVVTLSLDEKRAPWVAALQRQHPPWPHSLAELVPLGQSQTARRLHVRLTPKLLLVDQAGRLVGRYASVADLTAAATNYLSRKSPGE
jgi:hypothetical protein